MDTARLAWSAHVPRMVFAYTAHVSRWVLRHPGLAVPPPLAGNNGTSVVSEASLVIVNLLEQPIPAPEAPRALPQAELSFKAHASRARCALAVERRLQGREVCLSWLLRPVFR